MVFELLNYHPMEQDFDSGWMPAVQYGEHNRKNYARSIQVLWNNAAGDFSGSIKISATNDPAREGTAVTYLIDKSGNSDDPLMILVSPLFSLLRLEYSRGGISDGDLFINIFYDK